MFTAKHLRRRAGGDVRIELISRNNFFVFQPLLPEVAGGNIQPAPSDGNRNDFTLMSYSIVIWTLSFGLYHCKRRHNINVSAALNSHNQGR